MDYVIRIIYTDHVICRNKIKGIFEIFSLMLGAQVICLVHLAWAVMTILNRPTVEIQRKFTRRRFSEGTKSQNNKEDREIGQKPKPKPYPAKC